MLDFGRDVCGHLPVAERREWLVTNGIGGYASGTVSSLLTRRYHGLLIAALRPPLGRTLLLNKLDETATYDGRTYPLFANRRVDGLVEPIGFQYLERFRLEGTTPVWTFTCADAPLRSASACAAIVADAAWRQYHLHSLRPAPGHRPAGPERQDHGQLSGPSQQYPRR